jgi:hypothetical protein
VFSLPIIGETGESVDVMLPIWLSFIRSVPLLGRRIAFGDAALGRAGYILVDEGVNTPGLFMLSAVPRATPSS